MARADLQIDWLRAFVAVVDAGSLSAAAPHVHRSQSALSMQLKKLEDAVGRPVLTRGPRHLALTATGNELLEHARRLLALHAEALAAMHGPQVSGQLRLGVPDDYAVPYLTPVLRAYATRHAGVEITLVCEQSTVLIPKIARGRAGRGHRQPRPHAARRAALSRAAGVGRARRPTTPGGATRCRSPPTRPAAWHAGPPSPRWRASIARTVWSTAAPASRDSLPRCKAGWPWRC
jgi:DNA-binding transcriptional LysR family regulator